MIFISSKRVLITGLMVSLRRVNTLKTTIALEHSPPLFGRHAAHLPSSGLFGVQPRRLSEFHWLKPQSQCHHVRMTTIILSGLARFLKSPLDQQACLTRAATEVVLVLRVNCSVLKWVRFNDGVVNLVFVGDKEERLVRFPPYLVVRYFPAQPAWDRVA